MLLQVLREEKVNYYRVGMMKSPYSRAGRMLRSSKFHYAAVCKKKSLTKSFDSVKDEYTIRGATLIHDLTRALSEIPSYLRQITSALRRRIL